MKVVDFLKIAGVVTAMAILYIYLQIEIYTLAYQGKVRQQQIEKLTEQQVLVNNDILRLKSSDHLGRELLVKEKEYSFASRKHVVEVESSGQNWLEPITDKVVAPSRKFMELAFSSDQEPMGK